MKSVSVTNVYKFYNINSTKNNFKEFIVENVIGAFRREKDNGERKFYALKNISFELDKGDVLGIIGDNGAGKSTLLKIISGVSQPSTGEVALDGKISSILEIGTGFHLELSGRENIFLSGSILGMSRSEIERQYNSIVRYSGLEDFINVPIKRYSSGMYLRLAFSVLAHLSTDIILLDEIIYVGDAEFKMKSYNKIKELAQSGRTVLIVSHDLASISELCSKCLLIEKGEIKLFGNTSSIVRQYLDKSLLKYMNSSAEEQNQRMKREMEELQDKINELHNVIRGKDENLNQKEQSLVAELDHLKKESEELFKIREAIKADGKNMPDSSPAFNPERNWSDEQSAPGNEIVKLKKIAVTTSSNGKSFTQGDELVVEIEYWKYVEEPLIIGLTASYNFNRMAFGTASSYGESDALKNEGIGLYTNYCRINKYLLNQGLFSFSIFFLNNKGDRVFSFQDITFIKVNELPAVYEKFNYKGNLFAPFLIGLKWW